MKIVGQKNLRSKLSRLWREGNLPNTLVFVGPKGQGKKTVAKWLADKMNAPVYIPEDLKIDSIRELNKDSHTISSPKMYLLADAENMTQQAQNALLKLAEEPPEYAFIVITVQDTHALLPTIISRSNVYRLDSYSMEELKEFTQDEDLIKISGNPGNIQSLSTIDYKDLYSHARKVVDNIARISAANAFNILKYIDKEHYDVFLLMIIHCYGEKLREGGVYAKQLQVVYSTKSVLQRSKSVNRQNALEMMFVKLREAARSELH